MPENPALNRIKKMVNSLPEEERIEIHKKWGEKSEEERVEFLDHLDFLEFELSLYGLNSLKELNEFHFHMREAHKECEDQEEISWLINEINKGKRPNKKDIIHILRNNSQISLPETLKYYTAEMLANELSGKQRNSRVPPPEANSQRLMRHSSKVDKNLFLEVLRGFSPILEDFKTLCERGYTSNDAIKHLAKAEWWEVSPFDESGNPTPDLDVNRRYKPELKTIINRLSNLIYPRNQK